MSRPVGMSGPVLVLASASPARLATLRAAGIDPVVRVSAVDEDGAQASFAGQHITLLNIRTVEAVSDAVREIWWSANSDSAITYRQASFADRAWASSSSRSSTPWWPG